MSRTEVRVPDGDTARRLIREGTPRTTVLVTPTGDYTHTTEGWVFIPA